MCRRVSRPVGIPGVIPRKIDCGKGRNRSALICKRLRFGSGEPAPQKCRDLIGTDLGAALAAPENLWPLRMRLYLRIGDQLAAFFNRLAVFLEHAGLNSVLRKGCQN